MATLQTTTPAPRRGLRALGLAAWLLAAAGLAFAASQTSCAEAVSGWGDPTDGPTDPGDGGTPDGDTPIDRCYTGTPTSETQFYNKCTAAETVSRPSNIPPEVWDGKTPLPTLN